MEIAEASLADIEAMTLVNQLAFADDEVVQMVRELLADPTAAPAFSLLAWEGDRPIGHVLFTAAHVQGADRDVTAAILAPLAVVPERQRQGVGGRLIGEGVEQLAQSGVELVFVLGHPAYYPKHGFEPASRHGLKAPYPITPDEAWMVRELRPGVLGTIRGTIRCADALMRPELWRE